MVVTMAINLRAPVSVGHTDNMKTQRRREVSTPNATWLRHHAERGMTQHQMVDEWERESGMRVSRSAIAMAMQRADIPAAKPRPRYEDMLPWHVRGEHRLNAQARLLRLEGRRRKGGHLTDRELHWLTTWREELAAANAVIVYEPDTEEGFFWVVRTGADSDIIRRPV